jgi:hypothetical protein
MRRSTIIFALGAEITFAACSFPDVTISGDSGGSSSSGSPGGPPIASSSASAGGAAASSSTAASSSHTSSSQASSSSSGCATDDDHDGYLSWTCAPPGPDCADEDPLAHPGAGFEATPISGPRSPGTQPFDFDCDGVVETETPALDCGTCDPRTGFEADVPCGMSAAVGTCVGLVLCSWQANIPTMIVVQRCE